MDLAEILGENEGFRSQCLAVCVCVCVCVRHRILIEWDAMGGVRQEGIKRWRERRRAGDCQKGMRQKGRRMDDTLLVGR